MFSDIGIDLGTAKTVIVSGKTLLLSEPSVVLMDQYDEVPVSFGRYAQRALGRSTDRYQAVEPIERGVIANYDAAELMLNQAARRAGYPQWVDGGTASFFHRRRSGGRHPRCMYRGIVHRRRSRHGDRFQEAARLHRGGRRCGHDGRRRFVHGRLVTL